MDLETERNLIIVVIFIAGLLVAYGQDKIIDYGNKKGGMKYIVGGCILLLLCFFYTMLYMG